MDKVSNANIIYKGSQQFKQKLSFFVKKLMQAQANNKVLRFDYKKMHEYTQK